MKLKGEVERLTRVDTLTQYKILVECGAFSFTVPLNYAKAYYIGREVEMNTELK